jgi:iron-sulfur cluster assembly protein
MPAITLTEKAAREVKKIMDDTLAKETAKFPSGDCPVKKLYLRVRVVGGGCSGFQNKLDLDFEVNDKTDEIMDFEGVPVVVDKRSLMYIDGAKIDFHDEEKLRTGFSIQNPNAKGTCGCGSSWSM